VGFNKWWLMPLGILMGSALIALNIIVFQPAFVERSFSGVVAQPVAVVECSGERASDYACYQERYQGLVLGSGVKAAFAALKDEYGQNEFVKKQCHQMTHVIGRAAFDRLGDLSSTYGQGDSFCWSGYYHGAMEATVAEIGPERVLEEANTICADMGEGDQKYSFYHYNCAHGLGHGFMGIEQNELFESLETCDTMTDDWERESCYGGVFMENIMAKDNPSNPTKYLDADKPLYPCTDVETEYKEQCYVMQTSFALRTQGGDFGKVFDLCAEAEEDFRATCYQSLGRDASSNGASDVAKTREFCMMGEDYEARSNCVVGAVKDFISYYHGDEEARELCESFDADLREVCLETAEEYSKTFRI
jgi:hypothetical protein